MTRRSHYLRTIACLFAGSALPIQAQAQLVPDAGAIQRDLQKPSLDVPATPAPWFKPEEERARPVPGASDTRMVLNHVRMSGNTVFTQAELFALVQDIVGVTVGFADLEAAVARISRFYREHGYMVARAYLVRAYAPGPDMQDGVAEIAIIEGRYGNVVIDNHSPVRDSTLRYYADSLRGTVVRAPELERRLLLLKDLGGVGEARSSLRSGANVGESDLAVNISAAPVFSGRVEFDNHGNRYTGSNRLGVRLNVASPLGLGDALSARLTKGFNGLEYGRLQYQAPLGGDGFRVGGAYSASRYQLGKTFSPLAAEGEANNYTMNVSYPFIRSRMLNLNGQLSYDRSDFQDRNGAAATVIDRSTRVVNVMLSGDVRDTLGDEGITAFSLSYGGGRVNIQTPDVRVQDDGGARTQGDYGKWNLSALRLQSIGERASLYISLHGQKAGKNLDSSEKFVLGGANGIRAYPQGEASGDSGYVATAEFRYTVNTTKVPGMLQPFLFVDAGGVKINEKAFAPGANQRHLAGGGIGVSWHKANNFHVQLTLAARLGHERVTSDTDRHVRGWLQVAKVF